MQNPKEKAIVLRHDVDLLPQNALQIAKNENGLDIKASYYFRTNHAMQGKKTISENPWNSWIKKRKLHVNFPLWRDRLWNSWTIKEISSLGHEVGYHYENMDTCNGNIDKAWDDFRHHLDNLRKLADVKTICMHGSPRSEFDNKEIWNKYDYKNLGIIGEPYYDVDFDKVFYLTDTGRRWDGWKTSVRDKVAQQEQWEKEGLVFHSTNDIINAANQGKLQKKTHRNIRVNSCNPWTIMITMHPQRWHDNKLLWTKELVMQNIKNMIKQLFFVKN